MMKEYKKLIEGQRFGEERALYHLVDAEVKNCRFEGEEDGESALKESRSVSVSNCYFDLRYPFWHNENVAIADSEMTERCRAALWYDRNIDIRRSRLHGIKALRECEKIAIADCDIISPEFGWRSRGIKIADSKMTGEYAFFEGRNIQADGLDFVGKYSFQYVKNAVIKNSRLQTKDAFWHAKNITVIDSEISGEYLAWYSENLTLVNCKISGTQPLCYCKGLTLINCTTEGCDLSFEYSDVKAEIAGHIDSVKNPLRGKISAGSIGEIIREDAVKKCRAEIIVAGQGK